METLTLRHFKVDHVFKIEATFVAISLSLSRSVNVYIKGNTFKYQIQIYIVVMKRNLRSKKCNILNLIALVLGLTV